MTMNAHPDIADIDTPRLCLRLMSYAFLDACLRGRVAEASQRLGVALPQEWFARVEFIARRWQQLRDEPDYAEFAPRALLLRAADGASRPVRMVGHVGFHSAPDPAYLKPMIGHGIELGYTVFAADRRQGYAEEAVLGMVRWAEQKHAVRQIVASISPHNLPSQRLAAKLGFAKVGQHVDEVDGLEDVLVWQLIGTQV